MWHIKRSATNVVFGRYGDWQFGIEWFNPPNSFFCNSVHNKFKYKETTPHYYQLTIRLGELSMFTTDDESVSNNTDDGSKGESSLSENLDITMNSVIKCSDENSKKQILIHS